MAGKWANGPVARTVDLVVGLRPRLRLTFGSVYFSVYVGDVSRKLRPSYVTVRRHASRTLEPNRWQQTLVLQCQNLNGLWDPTIKTKCLSPRVQMSLAYTNSCNFTHPTNATGVLRTRLADYEIPSQASVSLLTSCSPSSSRYPCSGKFSSSGRISPSSLRY